MEVDLIIKLGFFVRDLHHHIDSLHSTQYSGHHRSRNFTVYRGQGLSHKDFNQLMKSEGGLLSFNCFLSTSKNRKVSIAFAQRSSKISHMMGILFVMTIDASISSTPFANIRDVSAYQLEEEILLSMHSIFRIGRMKQIDKTNDRIWQVELTLTSDKDPQLHDLTEHIRKETFSGHKGWFRLGVLLIKLGQFNKAEQVYDVLLEKSTKKDEKAHLRHMFGMIKNEQGKYQEAVEFYEKSIKYNKKILSPTHLDLAASYSGMGFAYRNMKDYPRALSYYEDALEIYKINFSPNHANLATCYNNIGFVYEGMEKYSKALLCYQKALEIYENTLPSNHPNLAASNNNIGGMHESLGKYSEALSCHEKALKIYQNTLPPNHPDIACSIGQIGMVSSKIGDHSRAVEYCERALKMLEYSLPSDHPEIQLYKANLESVKENL
jgi:tetratricopeptide (TPR) repeat protein